MEPTPARKRRKGPDKGHEPGDKDGRSSPPVVETMRTFDVLFLDKARELFHKDFQAYVIPQPVIDRIPDNRTENVNRDKKFEV